MALSTTDLLALLNRAMDPAWVENVRSSVDGQAVIDALLLVGASMSTEVDAGAATADISLAPGGSPGTCSITFTRAAAGADFTIPKGYQFQTVNGVLLTTTADLTFPNPTTTFVVPLTTLRSSEAVNTWVDPAFAAGLTGEDCVAPWSVDIIDSALVKVMGAPDSLPVGNSTVTSSTPITGALSDWLSVIGTERGQKRQAYETTDYYRPRVRNIVDVVSPKAISIAVNGVADRRGIGPAVFTENTDSGEDATTRQLYNLALNQSVYGEISSVLRHYWDTLAAIRAGVREYPLLSVSNREARAYFEITLPGKFPDGTEQLFFSNDGFFDDPVYGFADSVAAETFSTYMTIWEEANRKRAGGVQFDVVSNTWTFVEGHVQGAWPAASTVNLTPPGGKYWILVDCSYSCTISPGPPWGGAGETGQVQFTFSDATTFTTPFTVGTGVQELTDTRLVALGYPFGKFITTITLSSIGNPIGSLADIYGLFRVIEYTI